MWLPSCQFVISKVTSHYIWTFDNSNALMLFYWSFVWVHNCYIIGIKHFRSTAQMFFFCLQIFHAYNWAAKLSRPDYYSPYTLATVWVSFSLFSSQNLFYSKDVCTNLLRCFVNLTFNVHFSLNERKMNWSQSWFTQF